MKQRDIRHAFGVSSGVEAAQSAAESAPSTATTSAAKKRYRNFKDEDKCRQAHARWFATYDWLRIDKEGVMFCNVCSLHGNMLYAFQAKVHNLKRDTIAVKHTAALALFKGVEFDDQFAIKTRTEFGQQKERPNTKLVSAWEGVPENLKAEFERKRFQFQTVYYILKKRMPMIDYPELLSVHQIHPVIGPMIGTKHVTAPSGWDIAEGEKVG